MRLARKEHYEPTPICRCRVLYLGSSVPQVTKDGLQGIQEPLRELYPSEGAINAKGIDSWLSVWSNGLLLENVDENQKKVTRFFPIESLHYCAAVRYVVVVSGADGPPIPRFLPLDSPFARNPSISHPPLFACILRRTTGIKVLECHAFICKRETPANALVRCCFHAFADSKTAKTLEGTASREGSLYGGRATEEVAIELDYTGDLSSANSEILPISVRSSPTEGPSTSGKRDDEISIYNGDENHKVWAGPPKTETEVIYSDYGTNTMRSARSASSLYGSAGPSKVSRPRQMIMPSIAPPPPPAKEPEKDDKKSRKEGKHKGRDEDDGSRLSNGRPPSALNGRRIPVNGSLPRPVNGMYPLHPMNGSLVRSGNAPSSAPKPKGKIPRMFSSLSERKNKGKRPPPPFIMIPHGPPHPMGPPVGAAPPPPNMIPNPHMPPTHMPPSYLPPAPHMIPGPHGPMPPHMAGPMPPHMAGPMPPHMVGPYGPLNPPYGRRPHSRAAEEPIYMPSSRPMSPTASYQPGHFPHEQYLLQQYASTGRPKHKKKKKKGKDLGEEDIYGRKGHINERAFSHSIREEHRSQSYASLVGLDDSQLSKKDKEMMQMVADLDLSGDDIERVEVRPGVYRPPTRSEISGTVNSRASRR